MVAEGISITPGLRLATLFLRANLKLTHVGAPEADPRPESDRTEGNEARAFISSYHSHATFST